MIRSKLLRLRAMIEKASATLPDADAQDVPELFKAWANDTDYLIDDRRQYGGILYKCVQAHRSQADWTPNKTPALWVRVSVEEWPEWVQPIGAQDAYVKGAKCSHNGKHWVSDIDNNVWEPGVAMWTEE